MVGAILASSITVLLALLTFAWYLSARLTKQDGWMYRVNIRMARMEKHLGLAVWEDNSNDLR